MTDREKALLQRALDLTTALEPAGDDPRIDATVLVAIALAIAPVHTSAEILAEGSDLAELIKANKHLARTQ